jgi:hypothetical protein
VNLRISPAPWNLRSSGHVDHVVDANDHVVATVAPRQEGGNGDLLKAAPALAEALAEAVQTHEQCARRKCWCAASRAALRAAGRSL